MKSARKDEGNHIEFSARKNCFYCVISKINNTLQFHLIDQSTIDILSRPQPDDAIWCDQVNPDCSKELTITYCRKYCQSTYEKGESILQLWWFILKL